MDVRTFREHKCEVQEGLKELFQQTGSPHWLESQELDIVLDVNLPQNLQDIATGEVLHAFKAFNIDTVCELAVHRRELPREQQQLMVYEASLKTSPTPRIYLTSESVTSPANIMSRNYGPAIGVADRQKGIIIVSAGDNPHLQENLRFDTVRYTLRHELGHLLGLLGHHDFHYGPRGEESYSISDFDSDIATPCIMRAGVTVAPVDYCNRCKLLASAARKTVTELLVFH